MFAGILEWYHRRQVIRELHAKQREYSRDFSQVFKQLIEDANSAVALGSRKQAFDIWSKARESFPDLALTSRKGFEILVDCARYDEAEQVMKEGLRRFPNQPFYREGLVLIAQRRGDRDEAYRQAELLRKRYPGIALGYRVAASCLREMGRMDEALAVIKSGLHAVHDDIGLWLEAGNLAIDRKDWNGGMEIWTEVRSLFNHVSGAIGVAQCLIGLGRVEEAEELLNKSKSSFPLEYGPWRELALISERKGDWEEAIRRWEILRTRFPMFSGGYQGIGEALKQLGREAEFDEILKDAVDRIREDAGLVSRYAWLAHGREDWPAAADRWALMRERFPSLPEGYERGAEALANLGRHEEAASIRSAKP